MILIAGGTGKLGTRLIPKLNERVRVLTRDPARARHLAASNVEVAVGDLRDPDAVRLAMAGVSTVIGAVQAGFGASGGSTPQNVDLTGIQNLITAAKAEGVQHFVLLSIIDAAPDHPLELWRMKYHSEQALQTSGLAWTVIRSTAFMEWCLDFIGRPLWTTGRTRIFGRGNNPINFVSAADVAALVALAVNDKTLRNRLLTIAGPDNLSFNQVIALIHELTGASGKVSHVPLPIMRVMSKVVAPIKPALAQEIKAGIFLDTADRTANATTARADYPGIPISTMAEVILEFPGAISPRPASGQRISADAASGTAARSNPTA